MALKKVNSNWLDANLEEIADALRNKGITSDTALAFTETSNEMADAINDFSYIVPSGTKTISSAGTHDVKSYANATVADGVISSAASFNSTTGVFTASAGVSTEGYVETTDTASDTYSLTLKDADDLSVSARTVTVPAGYYPSEVSKSVSSSYIIPSGTKTISSSGTHDVKSYQYAKVATGSATTPDTTILATPSISVDEDGIVTAIAQGSDSITPAVTAGYVSSGTAGTVSVDSRNSYNLPITAPGYDFSAGNGKITAYWTCTEAGWVREGSYSGQVDATTLDSNLKAANIANGITIFGVTGTHAQFNSTTLTVTPTTSQQVFNASDESMQGYYKVTVNAMPSGTLKTPTGSITNATGKVSISSGVSTSGYIASTDTKSGSLQLTTQAAQTITPGTSNKTISAYRWLTGTQTIKGDSNLVASNIKSGVSIFGVTGTYSGSGGGSSSSGVSFTHPYGSQTVQLTWRMYINSSDNQGFRLEEMTEYVMNAMGDDYLTTDGYHIHADDNISSGQTYYFTSTLLG